MIDDGQVARRKHGHGILDHGFDQPAHLQELGTRRFKIDVKLLVCVLEHISLLSLPDDKNHSFHSRSEEHTSELQSLMRISYAVFCLKKKNYNQQDSPTKQHT